MNEKFNFLKIRREIMRHIYHIAGLYLDRKDNIQLHKNIVIRKFNDNELKCLHELYEGEALYDLSLMIHPVGLEIELENSCVRIEVLKFFDALWIFVGKAIFRGGVLFYDNNNLKYTFFKANDSFLSEWYPNEIEIKNFIDFKCRLNNFKYDLYDVGIKFFREAMTASSNEEKLLKLTIALERILIPDGSQELSFKFRTRAAILLSKGLKERGEKSEFFKKIYTMRSEIIHGKKSFSSGFVSDNKYKRYLNDCRKLLCIFIENFKDKQQWTDFMKNISLGEDNFSNNLAKDCH